jgi:hypothetical protein
MLCKGPGVSENKTRGKEWAGQRRHSVGENRGKACEGIPERMTYGSGSPQRKKSTGECENVC